MERTTKYPPYIKRYPYAIYTRYPEGVTKGGLAEKLKCPKCGAEEITVLKEFEFGASGMLGDIAQCWICKCKFSITDNCWHPKLLGGSL
jgi:hypothetical protein